MNQIPIIVLTGGPCAGKTTVIETLIAAFGGLIIVVREVATALFEAGFPPPNPWTPAWQKSLQAAIVRAQYQAEYDALASARQTGGRAVVCDRGLLDGAAYLPGGVPEFSREFGVDADDAIQRYQMVIHLESLATLDPGLYSELMATNPHRFEPVEVARDRELALRQAWSAHPDRRHLAGPIRESADRVIQAVRSVID